MKKIIFVICLILAVNVFVGVSYAQNEDFNDEVYVGGVKITYLNKDDVLSDGGSVKYNDETNTLTLTDATILNEAGHGVYAYGINLTVIGVNTDAAGNNSIFGKSITETGIDEEGYEYSQTYSGFGIYVEGDGYEGNGSLTLKGNFGTISGEDGHGIGAYRDIDISAAIDEINCTGEIDSAVNSSFGCVIIKDTAVIGRIISNEYDGIEANSDIIISGDIGEIFGGGYAGIHATSGDIFITGNVKTIAGYAGGIEAYKGSSWDMDGNEFSHGGSVKIGGEVGEITGGIVGIYADAHLNLSGSAEISATDLEYEETRAISVGGEMIISDTESFIEEPKEYKIDTMVVATYEDENGIAEVHHNTIYNADGTPAKSIKFNGFVNSFEDVAVSDWYYEDVMYVTANGMFNGVTETTFEPQSNLTRAMLVTVLWRMENKPVVNYLMSFKDVNPDTWYTEAVRWAASEKLVNGYSDTVFAPDENVTREQIAAIIFRYATKKGVAPEGAWAIKLDYADLSEISDYAVESVMYCKLKEIMQGKNNNNFAPKDNATRAEAAAILHRIKK